MRAIVVMFDSMNRQYLPSYAPDCGIEAPHFERLAARTVQFDNAYVGSMPCMPARRELHTGRYNFLHRGWGPLEPFDDSVPQMLQQAGITTHLATDHMHYWEDGGATYHTRYGTCSLVRGQQGDPWKGRVADPSIGEDLRVQRNGTWRQDRINRGYIHGLAQYPQTLTFDAGLEFIRDNHQEQNWFVQIETFDPHEPFDAAEEFRRIYGEDPGVPDYDWPQYMQVVEDDRVVDAVRRHYAALVSQCDASLGRVLDAMDTYDLWGDTMLIVCTDHGFLLGEQGWWGKSVMPWFDETAHIPLFTWDPVTGHAGTRNSALVQTIDIGPTLLDHFGLERMPRMQGRSLRQTIAAGDASREYAMFGTFGGHICVTDGRFVYMRASIEESNSPLFEHTLMPTHMRGFFSASDLADAELVSLPFTQGIPILRVKATVAGTPYAFGTLLFDLKTDPRQQTPIIDDDVELRMADAMTVAMRDSDAPASQFARIGLPAAGAVDRRHLLVRAQRELSIRARETPPTPDSFPSGRFGVLTPMEDLMADDEAAAVIRRHAGPVNVGAFASIFSEASLYRAAPLIFGVLPWQTLRLVADDLVELGDRIVGANTG